MLGVTMRPTVLAILTATALGGAAALPGVADAAKRRNVELLSARIKPASHAARGTATVVATASGRRVLNLRRFRIDPGPLVKIWLVPKSARSDGAIDDDYRSLGRLRGSRGNQSFDIPKSVDLRRYSSVVFWCVPFTTNLARADLRRS